MDSVIENFRTRLIVATTVWVAALAFWLLMIGVFSSTAKADLTKMGDTIAHLADGTMFVAQLFGVICLLSLIALAGIKARESDVRTTQRMFLSETLTMCINFAVVFLLAAGVATAYRFLAPIESARSAKILPNVFLGVLNLGIAYAVWKYQEAKEKR